MLVNGRNFGCGGNAFGTEEIANKWLWSLVNRVCQRRESASRGIVEKAAFLEQEAGRSLSSNHFSLYLAYLGSPGILGGNDLDQRRILHTFCASGPE